jgi:hypothetical protein
VPSGRGTRLSVRLKKRADGGAVLRCTRADGSETWQRHAGHQAAFFPLHDLTHFAVETTLGERRAFFGLVASGWDIADTTGKGPRGPLPPEAIAVEQLVGMLDGERGSGVRMTATDMNEAARIFHGPDGSPPFTIDDGFLDRVRKLRASLFARWHALVPGAELELTFEPDPGTST